METTKERISDLTGNIREYIETRIDLIKLDVADSGASAASSMVSWIAITILGLITLLLISVGGAIGLGYLFENMVAGFFAVAGLYTLIALILYFNRENWLRKPLLNTFIKNIYEND